MQTTMRFLPLLLAVGHDYMCRKYDIDLSTATANATCVGAACAWPKQSVCR